MRPILLMAGLWCLSIASHADGIDDLSRALDPKMSVESMVIAGVVGKTVDHLRDPRSVQIKSVGYGRSADVALGCLEYRAKNGFGGMVEGYSVWRLSVVKKKPSLLFTMDKAGDWNKHCAKAPLADKTAIARRVVDKIRGGL